MKYLLKFKYYTFLVALFAMIIAVNSCNKDEISQVRQENNDVIQKWIDLHLNNPDVNQGLEKDEYADALSSIVKSGDILCFTDLTHFYKTLGYLEEQLENHLDSFEFQYKDIPIEDLDEIAEKEGFDDWQPLIDFENSFNFSSRRSYIETQILNWLDNPNLDFNNDNDPDPDDFDDFDEELRTLLNVDGEVMIEGEVYDYDLIDEQFAGPKSDCSFWKKNKHFFPYGTDGKGQFKLKISLRSYPWKIKQKGKVVHYRRGSNGKFKRRRSVLTVEVTGSVRTQACNFALTYGAFKGPKRRKSLKCKRVNWEPPTLAKYKSNEGGVSCTINDGDFSGALSDSD